MKTLMCTDRDFYSCVSPYYTFQVGFRCRRLSVRGRTETPLCALARSAKGRNARAGSGGSKPPKRPMSQCHSCLSKWRVRGAALSSGDAHRRQPQSRSSPRKRAARTYCRPCRARWSITRLSRKRQAENIDPMGRLSRTDGEQTHYEGTAILPAFMMFAASDSTVSSGAVASGVTGLGDACSAALACRRSGCSRQATRRLRRAGHLHRFARFVDRHGCIVGEMHRQAFAANRLGRARIACRRANFARAAPGESSGLGRGTWAGAATGATEALDGTTAGGCLHAAWPGMNQNSLPSRRTVATPSRWPASRRSLST